MGLRQKTLDEISHLQRTDDIATPENDRARNLREMRVARNVGLTDARNVMLYDYKLKPSTRKERLEAGITKKARPGQDIYILDMPMGYMAAIAITQIRPDIDPPLAVEIAVFDYDSNRKSAIEHAQNHAIDYRDSVAEELQSLGAAKHARGSSYSS